MRTFLSRCVRVLCLGVLVLAVCEARAYGEQAADGSRLNQPLDPEQRDVLAKYRGQLRREEEKRDAALQEYRRVIKEHNERGTISCPDGLDPFGIGHRYKRWEKKALRDSRLRFEKDTAALRRQLGQATLGSGKSQKGKGAAVGGVIGLRSKLAQQLATYGQVAGCLVELKRLETVPVARAESRLMKDLQMPGQPGGIRVIRKLVVENEPYAEFADNCCQCALIFIEKWGALDVALEICKLCGSEAMSAFNIRCLADAWETAASDIQDNTRKLEQLRFAVELYRVLVAKDTDAGYARDRIRALRKQIKNHAGGRQGAGPFSEP